MKVAIHFCLLLLACAASANELRDPTEWPAAVRAAAAASAPGAEAAAPARIEQVLIVEGRAYLVVKGRRYGVGEKFQDAQIVRISESAVWLKENGVTRREPLFTGVEKRPEGSVPPAGQTRKTVAKSVAKEEEKKP